MEFRVQTCEPPFATNMLGNKKAQRPQRLARARTRGEGQARLAREALSTAGYRQNGIVSLPSLGISRNSTADAP